MESPIVIYPPNRPLERAMKPTHIPVLYEHLFFLDVNNNGEIILGCSDVGGTYWGGCLFHYKNLSDAHENIYNGYFISNCTTSDAKILRNTNTVLLAEDSGLLKLLSMPSGNTTQTLDCLDVFDKSNRVEQIAVWDDANKAVTCSEQSIDLYNIANGSSITLIKKYENYHTDSITSVDTNKFHPNLFVSTSVDRKACIWDDRSETPASIVYTNEFSTLTSASWNPSDVDKIVVGSEAGDVYLLDVKQPKEFLSVVRCYDVSVHRVSFSTCGKLAVCGDSKTVYIVDSKNNELTKLYLSSEHKDIVRGLSWHNEELYSCGFDKKIVKHVL